MEQLKKKLISFLSVLPLFLLATTMQAQTYYVDNKGVLREKKGNKEVSFYGVNYTTPFAHAYRMHKSLGVDLKESIDKDVYHFARLGFNAYRVHVWDVEISDVEGNLIENEHLDLLDYLVAKLKERNIKLLFTPMAYWGNGYPERDDNSLPGFSTKWNKQEVTRQEEAIVAQERFLKQFVSHVNPYTGIAYKDEPDMVGFEINNEPTNDTEPAFTTRYVNRMVQAIRSTGCRIPIFYNMSHNIPQNTQAFYNAKIDGGTFQWYPSGLVANRTRKGNFLPAVDSYPIPFEHIKNFNKKALIVYEFDPADIADPYIYPAMARTFRQTGFQWITQFAYDPIEIAWANTEYQTHFLNLAYAPGKAISMKIAAEITKQVPRKKDFGVYPNDTIFDGFRVSYLEKLSEMNSPEKFIYANHTQTMPVNAEALSELIGYGHSPVIAYEGTGAYFLDKLSDGVWRLEIMPDAIWLEDPFGKASIRKEVATVCWHEWPMTIKLPNLGEGYIYQAINDGNQRSGSAVGATMQAYPGVYLLTRQGVKNTKWAADSQWGTIRLNEYVAPAERMTSFRVLHQPPYAVSAGEEQTLSATVVGPTMPDSVTIYLNRPGQWRTIPLRMTRTNGYNYAITLPAEQVVPGDLKYTIAVHAKGSSYSFPANQEGLPTDWDFHWSDSWTLPICPVDQYLALFDANRDFDAMEIYNIKGSYPTAQLQEGASPGDKRLRITSKELEAENRIIIRSYIKDKVDGRPNRLASGKQLCLQTGELKGIDRLEVGFVTTDGFTYKKEVAVGSDQTIQIPFSELALGKTILRPNGYPSFLPDYFTPDTDAAFDARKIEILEITTIEGAKAEQPVVELKGVWME